MSGPSQAPVDVVAIMADLQQQVSDLTGVVEAQQATLANLTAVVQAQLGARRQLLPNRSLPAAVPSAAPAVPAVPAPTGRSGGV